MLLASSSVIVSKITKFSISTICLFSITKSIFLISNDSLRLSNFSSFDDFMRFSNLDYIFFRDFVRNLYEIFNQTNRFQIRWNSSKRLINNSFDHNCSILRLKHQWFENFLIFVVFESQRQMLDCYWIDCI